MVSSGFTETGLAWKPVKGEGVPIAKRLPQQVSEPSIAQVTTISFGEGNFRSSQVPALSAPTQCFWPEDREKVERERELLFHLFTYIHGLILGCTLTGHRTRAGGHSN